LVGAVGIEPTTFGLKGRCSTTELRPYFNVRIFYMKTS
jgi:hypothetical protein